MHIGIDASSWGNNRGYGRYTRSILNEFFPIASNFKITLFIDSSDVIDDVPSGSDVVVVNSSSPTISSATASGHRSISDMWRMSKALSDSDIDVLLFPTIYSYVPVISQAKKLVIIHDTIPEMYPELVFPSQTGKLFWNIKATLGRQQADLIITVSDYSKRCLVQSLNINPERIHVVSEANNPIFQVQDHPELSEVLISQGITENNRIITYVGGFGPHKNLSSLLAVLGDLVSIRDYQDLKLVFVGEYKREVFYSEINDLQDTVKKGELQDHVIFTGYLSDEHLVNLLNLSTVLVLPSLMEGFGLPAVEAAACGCPVIATSESPLPHILGDGGLYVDPHKPDELRLSLERVLTSEDLRTTMRLAGLDAVKDLTWEKSARQLLEVINQVAVR